MVTPWLNSAHLETIHQALQELLALGREPVCVHVDRPFRLDAPLDHAVPEIGVSTPPGRGVVVPLALAFFYTWLYNRSRSILLCILLHASFTPAQDQLILVRDSATVDLVILATYLTAVVGLVAISRGRLGLGRSKMQVEPAPETEPR
jgi:hypothetical protein